MNTKRPEALRLAGVLRALDARSRFANAQLTSASEELETLHAENEQLRTGYDAARLEIASQQARIQELGQMARDVTSRRVIELEAQLESIGAGGVEPLRKRECLRQISEPVGAKCPSCGAPSEIAGFVCVDCYYAEQKTGAMSTDYVQGFAHGQATLAPPQPATQTLDAMTVTRTAQQDEALIRQMLEALERVTMACDVAEYENALFSACEAVTAARLRLDGKP